jgi:DNA recombination protein RmuC
MLWVFVAISGFLFVATMIVLWIFRSGNDGITRNMTSLRESVDTLQKNLHLLQERTERGQQATSQSLLTEMLSEFQKNRTELQGGLMLSSRALEERVSTLSKTVHEKLEQNLKEGFSHFEKVQRHLKDASEQLMGLNAVGSSINELNNLLKFPHLRGNFGEALLERILADTLPADSFELQYRIVPGSAERVDAIIRMPQYVIPIDSKFPREQVLPLFEGTNDEARDEARKHLAEILRQQARQIRDKYIHPEHGTAEIGLMFVPSETLYFEILRHPKLFEDLSKYKVFPVSPNTLTITLHSISMARSYYEMAKGVEKTIVELKKSRSHLEKFSVRFFEIGKSLEKAQEVFAMASTHLARYESSVTRLAGHEDNKTQPPGETPLSSEPLPSDVDPPLVTA